MSKRRWIQLDPNEYDEPREIGMADVEVDVFISPFEIPRGVRGYYDKARKRFVIQFKYIATHEPIDRLSTEPSQVQTFIGRNSGRIYEFEIDVDGLGAQSVSLRLRAAQEAIEAMREHVPSSGAKPWWNSHVANRVLQDRQQEVFAVSH